MRYIAGLAAVIGAAFTMAAGQGQAQSGMAVQRCHEIAGKPDSGAPLSREALAAHFSRLGEARAHCEAAVIGPDPDTEALFHLGVIMQREGVHERALEVFSMAAVAEYEKAAAAGDAPAKSTLAIMYQIGRGVPQDFDRMIALLKESADAGYHFAQFRLAELYMNPGAIPLRMAQSMDLPDPIAAVELYEQAAAQGSAEARAALEKFYDGGATFDDPEVQLKWLRHGAENGNAQAMNTLGFMYERGEGVDYDPVRAAELYIEALKTGDLPVAQLRGTVNGYQVRWDRETAINFQNILQYLGYYNGALDAIVGPGTLGAAQRLAQGQ